MKGAAHAIAIAASVAATTTLADDGGAGGRRASPAAKPLWAVGITAYPTIIRGGDNYTSAIAVADRGALHLEARVNYEDQGARSAFVGWTFAGGDAITWEVTPIVGGAWGTLRAFVPGVEASVAWRQVDFYLEGEYVRDRKDRDDSYWYAWSELGYRPAEWLRLGLVAQRTRAYTGERELQRGPFVQFTFGPVTVGGYWFNPGSNDQVFVGQAGVSF